MKLYLTRRECELLMQQLSYDGLNTQEKLELLKIEVRVKNVCAKQCARDTSMLSGVLALENLMHNKEENK